jgi:hypothetical protein
MTASSRCTSGAVQFRYTKYKKLKLKLFLPKLRIDSKTEQSVFNTMLVNALKKDGGRYPIDSIANCYYRFFSYMTPYLICQKKLKYPHPLCIYCMAFLNHVVLQIGYTK